MLKHLSESKLLDKKAAGIFIAEFKTDKATNKDNYWSINTGIKAVEFLGKYFNRVCADYLALRYSTNWQDNQIESNKVLAKLRIEF